jgi:hypothetical protein
MGFKDVKVGKCNQPADLEMKQPGIDVTTILPACAAGNFHAVCATDLHYATRPFCGRANAARSGIRWGGDDPSP